MQVVALPVALQRYVDAPPLAVRQRDLAALIAKAYGAQVLAISCEAPLGLVAQAETVAQKLAAFTAPLVAAGIDVVTRVVAGRPSEALLAAIGGADVAVVGTHSKRRVVDVTIGSTASALLRDLTCPVILVRPTAADEEQARRMTIPHYPAVFAYL